MIGQAIAQMLKQIRTDSKLKKTEAVFMIQFRILLLFFFSMLLSCSDGKDNSSVSNRDDAVESESVERLFKLVDERESGLIFQNNVTETQDYNYFKFQYSYNGSGVAIGDLNNDGLQDIYLVGNQVQDRLYVNKGDLQFEDITTSAGIKDKGGFHFGVTMVDVDSDSDLDIYVSVSGHEKLGKGRNNLLYINNGDLTFTESATEWGLADGGHSIQSAFFDYDNDGDLDMYLTNHPTDFGQNLKERLDKMKRPDEREKDKLFRNNGNGTFSDVTTEAGLINYGHGLGLVIWDINEDGWDDIYVANDYQSVDFVYVNNGDGTFTNELEKYFPHIPYYSMGVDVADLNNDGLMDINVVEMLPENYTRRLLNLTTLTERNYYVFNQVGFHHQYLRNSLGINTGQDFFSDQALMTGTDATDWSWATLIADFDNDGLQDMYTCNGYLRDMQDKDYMKRARTLRANGRQLDQKKFNEISVSTKTRNYFYHNKGDLEFENIAKHCGLEHQSFSTGAAYADLDQDGDLDLVVNNANLQLAPDPVFLYENLNKNPEQSLTLTFEGPSGNTKGEGCQVILEQGNESLIREMRSTRGYLSSMPPEIHFGLPTAGPIDKLTVIWPDGKFQEIETVTAGSRLVARYADAAGNFVSRPDDSIFEQANVDGLEFTHKDMILNEYDMEKQLPFRLGMQGPGACVGDVNGDGLDDIYLTSSHGNDDRLYLQGASGFTREIGPWEGFKADEHICAEFSDVDGDGDLDLYVGSGGIEKGVTNEAYLDKLFLNDGKANFTYAADYLPRMMSSTSCISFADYDGDGDDDAFIGSRSVPGSYGASPKSFLLRNDGGHFISVAEQAAPAILQLGMVSDATWYDADSDGDQDLIVVGEWSSPKLFVNAGGVLSPAPSESIPELNGFWRSVETADLDGDGIAEVILGNAGTNIKYQVTKENPLRMYRGDLDKDGTQDIMLAYKQGKYYHMDRGLVYLKEQFSSFGRKYPYHADFAGKSLEQIFGPSLAEAELHEANYLESCILTRNQDRYVEQALPTLAQVSYVNSIISEDIDSDGDLDLILAGNELYTPIQTGSSDASIGCILLNDGKGQFEAVAPKTAGLRLAGWVKGMELVSQGDEKILLTWRNNSTPLTFKLR